MSGLSRLEERTNQWFHRSGDGPVLPSSEIDLVAIPLSNRLQHGLDSLTPRFGAEV